MTWIEIRSPRERAVWLPIVVVVGALAVSTVWGFGEFSAWRRAIEDTAARDRDLGVAHAVAIIRACEISLCAVSLVFAAFLRRFFQLGLREERLPPSGWWSLGAWRAQVGESARRACRRGLWLVWLLPVSAILTVGVFELLLRSLLAHAPAS